MCSPHGRVHSLGALGHSTLLCRVSTLRLDVSVETAWVTSLRMQSFTVGNVIVQLSQVHGSGGD